MKRPPILHLFLLIVILLPASVHIHHWSEASRFPYDLLNALEGNVVAEAEALARQAPLYVAPESRPFITQAYPPTFSGIARLLLPWVDAPILTVRFAGFAFILLAGLLLGVFVFRETRNWMLAACAALIPAMVNPAIFALGIHYHPYHAASLAAWIAVVRLRETGERRWEILVILAASASGWTRQTGVLTPIICGVLLWTSGRWLALRVVVIATALILIYHGLLNVDSHGEYYRNCFGGVGEQPIRLINFRITLEWMLQHLIPVIAAIGLMGYAAGAPAIASATFLIAGIPWILAGFITSGKVGSGPEHLLNGLLPIWVAALLFLGNRGARVETSPGSRWRRTRAIAAVILLSAAALSHMESPRRITAKNWQDGAELERLVRASPGPILTDRHLAIVMPYHRPEYDLSRVFEAYRYEKHSPTQLIADIRARRFDLILSSRHYDIAEVRMAIDDNYRQVGEISSPGNVFYHFEVLRRAETGAEPGGAL